VQDYAKDERNFLPLGTGTLLWIVTVYFLLKTSFTDPGFIPFQPDDSHTMRLSQYFKGYLIVDGLHGQKTHLLKMRYCATCNIFRPKRAVHCTFCNVCVEQLDHHCPFVSNCIGRRNYVYFFGFINVLLLNTVFVLWVSI
jgi:palmitoyltransferase ZDHHC9/14/18